MDMSDEGNKHKKLTKNSTFSLGVVLLAMLIGLLVGVMTAPKLQRTYWTQDAADNTLADRMTALMHLVDQYYVDEVDYDTLMNQSFNAMLQSLDPHSYYLPPTEFSAETEMMEGKFEGIGLTLNYINDTVYGACVIGGSPAARAGLHPGDRVMWVDTTQVSGTGMTKEPSDVVDLIRGPRHSTVTLGVQRKGSKKIQYIKVQRDVIHHSSIPAAVMLDKTTGYIRISLFSSTTASEFHSALLQLNQEGMKHLVLDLRGNGGGSLESCLKVADELLPKGDLIVYTQGRRSRRNNIYATRGGLFETGKLTVLINEQSASASEIVSGCVQDNDRGTIVGHRSFGKGLVQSQFDMANGGAVMLTIARYYTPSGRCIQRPYDKGTDDYYAQYLQRVLQDYNNADSVLMAGVDTTQTFLTKKGRKVYGGGGIQPDIVLPYYSDSNYIYYNQLMQHKVLDRLAMETLNAHYDEFVASYPTLDAFVKNYQVDEATWQRILAIADKEKIKRQEGCLRKYGDDIRNRYKSILASSLYGENAYYHVSTAYDLELQQALKKVASNKAK